MNGRSGLFWRVYYLLYWGVAIGSAASVALSVTYTVFLNPRRAAAASSGLDQESCRDELKSLYQELKQHAGTALRESSGEKMHDSWRDFSTEWQSRLTQLKLRCDLNNPEHRTLKSLTHDVERMNLAYTTALASVADLSKKSMSKIEQAFGSNDHP